MGARAPPGSRDRTRPPLTGRHRGLMPRLPHPLPPELRSDAFTTAEARAAGVPRSRLRAKDLAQSHAGIIVPTGMVQDPRAEPWSPAEVRAYQRAHPHVVVSGPTAARLHGLLLPERLLQPGPVHLSVGTAGGRPGREGLVPHRVDVPAAHRVRVRGVVATSAPRTLWDLCAGEYGLSEAEVVVAGDALLRSPWVPGIGRGAPAHTREELAQVLLERGRYDGCRLARSALGRMRAGAESPRETLLRLALVDAGLPEPELQLTLDARDPRSPVVDLAYARWRLALQYEGRHHRSREQQERDVMRDRWCLDRGWLSLKVSGADHRQGYREVVARVRRRAAEFA